MLFVEKYQLAAGYKSALHVSGSRSTFSIQGRGRQEGGGGTYCMSLLVDDAAEPAVVSTVEETNHPCWTKGSALSSQVVGG